MHRDRNVELYRNLIKNEEKRGHRNDIIIGPSSRIEWLKWLSYIPEFEKTILEKIESKQIKDLEIEELEFLLKYKENEKILKLFEIVNKDQEATLERLEVYNYIKSHKISDLMLSKLTKEELEYAKEKITEYTNNLSKEEIRKKVENESKDEVYKDLSMIDSYILSSLTRVDRATALFELEEACKRTDHILIKNFDNYSKIY